MASSKSRKRQKRRDRRNAKQTGWKRHGKTRPKRVGHGWTGSENMGQ